jgi:hypothetical protein
MTGRPLVGLGIEDIRRGLDVLEAQPAPEAGCVGFAKGTAGVALLHAAAIDARLTEVIVEGGLTSYTDIARTPIHRKITTVVVPGVLGAYDLPDLAACLAPRPLALVDLRLPPGERALARETKDAYVYATAAYAAAGARERLTIGHRREAEPLEAAYPRLR